jgi:DNA-directed RNA polymerase specialized sigma24 family protein
MNMASMRTADRRGGKMNCDTSGGCPPDAARLFDGHRGLLFSVAYRILGSVSDAEDAVQEAWLRWSNLDHSGINDPRAFLVRVTTRLAIDRLRRPDHPPGGEPGEVGRRARILGAVTDCNDRPGATVKVVLTID